MVKKMRLDSNTQCRYTPDVGVVPEGENVLCGVCGDKMTETRDHNGARGFAQAMSKTTSVHDLFECPNVNEDWHRQVISLRRKAWSTPSLSLAALFEAEVDSILENREATKTFSMFDC